MATKKKSSKPEVENPAEAPEVTAKPKATKKKAAAAEISEPEAAPAAIVIEPVAAEPTKAKPAKKAAAKKAIAIADVLEETPKPKRATKPRTSKSEDKGRDLVTDEPGAAEVADVLGAHHDQTEDADEIDDPKPEPRKEALAPVATAPEPKLERLQKILAKAGISSRRKAEELITGGQVQINGKVITELGTKADPERDHIRVDGKLLEGPERIRYFVLNKPKGYVTTVSDPEGRPTVMQFFANERERLYPVGRLDYLSEGLLLITNDGELANKLTKASSGVEKTYLVKVAGQPTEDMLDALREGVVIERGRPGTNSGRVRTAPAKIRQVRQGDNPWYEVIIIEGRNRELRKMFEEIGHHVEKIRRVGYGPLILDQEPGKLRELEPEEVQALRLASEGKLKTRRRRGPKEAQLPTVAGKTVRYKKTEGRPEYEPISRPTRPFVKPAVRPEFQTESPAEFKPEKTFNKAIKTGFKREPKPEFGQTYSKEFNPAYRTESKPDSRPASRPFSKPGFSSDRKPAFRSGPGTGPGTGPAAGPSGGRPSFGAKPGFAAKPRANRPAEQPVTEYILPPRKSRPDEDFDSDTPPSKGAFNPDYKPGFRSGDAPGGSTGSRAGARPGARPAFRNDGPPKRFNADKPARSFRPADDDDDFVPGSKTPGFKIEPVANEPRPVRQGNAGRPASGGGRSFRPQADGPRSGGFGGGAKTFRPVGSRPTGGRSAEGRPSSGDRPFRPRPSGSDGPPAGGDRPFRPRPGGAPARSGEFRPRPASSDGPPTRRPKSFDGDAPREFKPREGKSFGGPKKFASKPFGAKPFGAKSAGPRRADAPRPQPGGSNSTPVPRFGPDGQPRIKERARNSFAGKNKGRPKPKS